MIFLNGDWTSFQTAEGGIEKRVKVWFRAVDVDQKVVKDDDISLNDFKSYWAKNADN